MCSVVIVVKYLFTLVTTLILFWWGCTLHHHTEQHICNSVPLLRVTTWAAAKFIVPMNTFTEVLQLLAIVKSWFMPQMALTASSQFSWLICWHNLCIRSPSYCNSAGHDTWCHPLTAFYHSETKSSMSVQALRAFYPCRCRLAAYTMTLKLLSLPTVQYWRTRKFLFEFYEFHNL